MGDTKSVHLIIAKSGDYNDQNFHLYYGSIASYTEWSDEKIFIGEKNKCRFCSSTDPEQFKNNTSHTCPEFTGNKWLFSNDECKSCNSIFSVYETALADYGHLMRSLSGIKGKRGVPTFKSSNESVRIKNDGKFGVKVHVDLDKKPPTAAYENLTLGIDFIKNEQTATLKVKQKSYIPLHLFKSLAKIGFSIMPKAELEAGGFDEFRDWIGKKDLAFTDENHEPYFYIYHNKLHLSKRKPLLMLFKKRDEFASKDIPTFSFLFAYGSHVFQIFLPYYSKDNDLLLSESLSIYILPEIAIENKNGKHGLTWMNGFSLEKFEPDDYTLTARGALGFGNK